MRFIKKNWLLIAAAVAALYFLVINKTALSTLTGSVDPVNANRYPPPGYTGPSLKGPFVWAGVGSPPNGEYTTLGYTYDEARAKNIA